MQKLPLMLSVLASLSFNIGCTEQKETSVAVDWIIDPNLHEDGTYTNTIHIINDGALALDTNWTIYFCAFPKKFILPDNSPITIERISGTYYKIKPSSTFSTLNATDTLTIPWNTTSRHTTTSFAPTRAYIVRNDANGNALSKDIRLNVLRKDPVPSAANEYVNKAAHSVYTENAMYQNIPKLTITDILPTIKSVKTTASDKSYTFSSSVRIEYSPLCENEANLLRQQLTTNKCSVSDSGTTVIRLNIIDDNKSFVHPEQYQMNISESGIDIIGTNPTAIFNGMQTLLAMTSDKELPVTLPLSEITDYPDMDYRGFMIDVARNFTTKDNLLKLIDVLASYKMNTLHLHVCDDEGWRIEIPGLEELSQIGGHRGHTVDESDWLQPAYFGYSNPNDTAGSGNGYYTVSDFVEILRYANERHINIIPEIDLPGHARAAILAMKARYNRYKDSDRAKAEEYLLSEPTDTSKYVSVQGYTDNVVNVALPSTYRFVTKVISEINQMYEQAGLELDMIHIGGDEVPKGAWTGSPSCKALMEKMNMQQPRELKDYFVEQVIHNIKPMNLRLAGWQEVVLKPHSSDVDSRFANENVLSYCWNTTPYNGNDELPYKLANNGFEVVLSNVSNLYMDLAYSNNYNEPGHTWGGYVDDRSSFDMQPYNLYSSVRRNGKGEPIAPDNGKDKTQLKADARKKIRGMQGQLWTETVGSFEMVGYYMFPKIFGLVERCWNSEPAWIKSQDEKQYAEAIVKYNTINNQREFVRLNNKNINFRISEPGIVIKDGKLMINDRTHGSVIRFTTDGSEPTAQSPIWTAPVECNAQVIKAKAFYLGKESVTSMLLNNTENDL